jgi:hypothetical protein
MPESNEHKNFTAEDIQRYLEGKMTAAEMHQLEKAALDDEFLADALEGYASLPDKEHAVILQSLKENISSKANQAKIIPVKSWWRQGMQVAAAILFLSISATLLYKYVFTSSLKPAESVAEVKKDNAIDMTLDSSSASPEESKPALAQNPGSRRDEKTNAAATPNSQKSKEAIASINAKEEESIASQSVKENKESLTTFPEQKVIPPSPAKMARAGVFPMPQIVIGPDSLQLAEPENGWQHYNQYVVANFIIPEKKSVPDKPAEIVLQFTVNEEGLAQNISVEKSSFPELNAKAIQLLKEGPKWKIIPQRLKGRLYIRF